MADSTGPTMTANRVAMSKALGAAFLSHQVEQLEQKVSGGGSRGGGGGNWREGRKSQGYQRGGFGSSVEYGRDGSGSGGGGQRRGGPKGQGRRGGVESERRWRGEGKSTSEKEEKDADVVVVDVSVLVHGIAQLKKWCREGRQEVVIIPLEALNTLDLLKKGTTSLAQRARAASRILEAQVGTNPRIRVQRDDAFVLWDEIPFSADPTPTSTMSTTAASPEWVRRTICCARWEVDHPPPSPPSTSTTTTHKVVLAVCTTDQDTTTTTSKDGLSSTAPPTQNTTISITSSPVPLPAPQTNKFEPRSTGRLVQQWAVRAGVPVFEVSPSASAPGQGMGSGGGNGYGYGGAKEVGGRRSGEYGRRSPEDDRMKLGRGFSGGSGNASGVGVGNGGAGGGRGGGGGGQRRSGSHGHHHYQQHSKPLVERPPAVMAMMEAVSQPSRVVRVLARGEKLDAN